VNKWKCNLAYPKQWVDISFIIFSNPTKSTVTINNIIMINATKAKKNPNATNEIVGV
jgi:hypothetical protein